MASETFIIKALRSPIGSLMGELATLSAVDLSIPVVQALLSDLSTNGSSEVEKNIEHLIMGNVLGANLGQAPARQVVLKSGLDKKVSALTINKVCSSGLMAVILADQMITSGKAGLVIAGGAESMSNVPHYLPKYRSGCQLGHGEVIDGIIKDGLWDVYNNYHMGMAGELCASKYGFSREDQDAYALESYRRANSAIESGKFTNEVVSMMVRSGKSEKLISRDEEPGRLISEKVKTLKPVFSKDGTITAANASSINDGASFLLLASAEKVKEFNLEPIGKIVSTGMHSQEPEWFTTAPVQAIRNCLRAVNQKIENVDLFEINEAFSSVALACIKDLGIDDEKVNINGGAVSLGHPIGASGARILTTLVHALRANNKKLGMAGICNGGGEATSLLVELI